jgi:hypothetical protein
MTWFLAGMALLGGGLVMDLGGPIATVAGWALILLAVALAASTLRLETDGRRRR